MHIKSFFFRSKAPFLRAESLVSSRFSSLIRHVVFAVFVAGLMSACDSDPGFEDLSASAPVVQDLSVTPDFLALAPNGSEEQIAAEVMVSFDVSDVDGDLLTAFVIVNSPTSGDAPVGTVEISLQNNTRVQAMIDLSIPRGSAGIFMITAFASDMGGRMSNRIFASIDVTSESDPPVITQIDIPGRVTRPAAGQPAIDVAIVAHVSDPDGLDNVAFVEVVVNGAVTLRLCDDGGQGSCNGGFASSGDVAAGDGLFTLTIQLDSNNAPGTNTFEFTAVDRSGLRSETVVEVIEVD